MQASITKVLKCVEPHYTPHDLKEAENAVRCLLKTATEDGCPPTEYEGGTADALHMLQLTALSISYSADQGKILELFAQAILRGYGTPAART